MLDQLQFNELQNISIVAPEFGATYPCDFSNLSLSEIRAFKGAYGCALDSCESWDDVMSLMPSYTRKNKKVPEWIARSVQYSRQLYLKNSSICDLWAKGLDKINNSWQILEWRGLKNDFCINNHIVQFRASGIRILKPSIAPSLIAMTPTQIPVIPSQSRYVSKYEAAKLQYLESLKELPHDTKAAFKALGNAVNARIVELITKSFSSIVV